MKQIILLKLFLIIATPIFSQGLQTYDHSVNYKTNPLGVGNETPRFSWKIAAEDEVKDVMQTSYHLQVMTDTTADKADWDSKKTKSDKSVFISYKGDDLQSKTRYFWRVKVWDNKGRESTWSKYQFFETALFDTTEWKAKWIETNLEEDTNTENPAPYLRKDFELEKEVKKARLYITAHGMYDARINGKKVTTSVFNPGWTSYNKRLQYQTYDVTDLLQKGENATGVILGDGWYRGRLAWNEQRNVYGKKLALLYQLEIEFTDGTTQVITSDKSWKANQGPIQYSSIYHGEKYDANLEMLDWDKSGFKDKKWADVTEVNHSLSSLLPQQGEFIKEMITLDAKEKIITPKNELVIDFAQNLTGYVEFKLKGKKGDTITIYHAEVLDKEGNFYTANLRSAKQIIKYIFADDKEVSYKPHFTFQGFRYIKIEGVEDVDISNFKAHAVYSDMQENGSFICSDSLVNQLQSNIQWGQRGNFLDVPTDCPQRDERLGWTGDAQAFAATAIFNYNVPSFFSKWLEDLKADQSENGSVPFVIPDVLQRGGSTGWGDAATIIPYELYIKYGDKQFLEAQYESMKAWVAFLESLAGEDFVLDSGFHFGDWLFFIHPTYWNAKPGYTDVDLISTAFLAYSTELTMKTAKILGKDDDAKHYTAQLEKIKTAFRNEFMTPTGRLSSHSQTAYILALEFDLLPEELRQNAINYLVENIKKRKYHLSTGFLGTPYINKVLTENGYSDVAYKLLMQKEYPSWLYPVTKGATTIWERWDGIKPDGTFQTTHMNSFNHYAYGAVGNWMYSYVCGIQTSTEKPGYKHIIIEPQVDTSLNMASASYESMYGEIKSTWQILENEIKLEVTIPPNTTATIQLPFKNEMVEVGSGKYKYIIKP